MLERMETSQPVPEPVRKIKLSRDETYDQAAVEHLVEPSSSSTRMEDSGENAGTPRTDTDNLLKESRDRDGSVVSAMTDPASLEGIPLPHLITRQGDTSSPTCSELLDEVGDSHDVPNQVILAACTDNKDISLGVSTGETSTPTSTFTVKATNMVPIDPEPLIVTTSPAASDQQDCVSLPERVAVEVTQSTDPETRSVMSISGATTPARVETLQPMEESVDDGGMDDYIKSPEVQNAIVERSPGGRYVRFMEKLGSGASKDVYRAYDTQEGIEVAWNVVNLAGVPKPERNRIVNEVRLLERLHHQNIISFHGSWVNRERQEVNFVTEILSSGTLKSFINKVQVIRWKIAKRWAVQILKGLDYLHSQDPPVIHRDLKCENIFINGTSGDLRIGDLGLSTVHRNGRVLSVLGTPEFMAPDMYEQSSYDEKVDVYAFGMCMLEIFTKEIPYSECNNPAQIYKKVSSGEPPEVLSRLQSKHARDFIVLCLGCRDEDGNYIRPSVKELLQHDFLIKRANDDDEVVVTPPIREWTIAEERESSAMSATPSKKKDQQKSSSQISNQEVSAQASEPRTARKKIASRTNSQEDEDFGDRFEEMQESEISMRKVKVLMGRGQELKEENSKEEQDNQGVLRSTASGDRNIDSNSQAVAQTASMVQSQFQQASSVSVQSNQYTVKGATETTNETTHPPEQAQYLVAAVVIENENPNVRPYDDDILKLVITLPVDGQTQNVQFDFHLVEDDAIQVAKEMVRELDIPQGAVLEISETISGLARTARISQDRHAVRMQQMSQNQMHSQYQQQHSQTTHTQTQHMQQQGAMSGQQEQVQYQQQYQPQQQMGRQESTPSQYHQQPTHQSQDRNASAHDIAQYQQSMQTSLHHLSQQSQSHQDFQQYHQQGGNSTQQYQQGVQPVHNHGLMNGGHSQDNGMLQQQQMQQQASHYHQPQMHHQGSASHYIVEQGVRLTNSPQDSTQQYNQGASSNNSDSQEIQPLLQMQLNHAAMMVAPSQEQTQYQHHQHLHQQGLGAMSTQEVPRHYQQSPYSQTGSHDMHQQQHRQQSGQVAPQQQQLNSASAAQVPQQQHVNISPDQFLQGQPPLYSQTHQPVKQAVAPIPEIKHSSHAMYSQPTPVVVLPPSNQQAYPSNLPHSADLLPAPATGSSTTQALQEETLPSFHNVPVGQRHETDEPTPQQVDNDVMSSFIGQVDEDQQHKRPPSGPGLSRVAPTDSVVLPSAQPSITGKAKRQGMARDETLQTDKCESHTFNISGRVDSAVTTASLDDELDTDAVIASEIDSDNEEILAEDIRRLDEEFQKNLQRAKKVFYNRMDNLQRSQVEREAQHQKTLEKHEKERLEFEKRLAQEEEQQIRRIEQLQREFNKKRESVARAKRLQKNGQQYHSTNTISDQGMSVKSHDSVTSLPVTASTLLPAVVGIHSRNTSAVSTFSVSPVVNEKKLPPPEINELDSQDGAGGNPDTS